VRAELKHRARKLDESRVKRRLEEKFGMPYPVSMATKETLRTPAIEDYSKAIFALESRSEEPVPTNALAERLGITAGSVSAMLKRLDDLGLITHIPYRGVRLTAAGRRIALEVIRHHRLLESYLAEVLGMSWDRVHAEAEVLEHVLSDDLEELIAAKLGHPTVDPHGDPIPTVEFDLQEGETCGLDELPIGAVGRFVRVSDSDPEILRYLAEHGIALGAELEVIERQPFGGPLFVRFGDCTHALGDGLTTAMRVERAGASQ
jgi:DtxR family transcriptional regulator, Mn-dependent transcriptional regulator